MVLERLNVCTSWQAGGWEWHQQANCSWSATVPPGFKRGPRSWLFLTSRCCLLITTPAKYVWILDALFPCRLDVSAAAKINIKGILMSSRTVPFSFSIVPDTCSLETVDLLVGGSQVNLNPNCDADRMDLILPIDFYRCLHGRHPGRLVYCAGSHLETLTALLP